MEGEVIEDNEKKIFPQRYYSPPPPRQQYFISANLISRKRCVICDGVVLTY